MCNKVNIVRMNIWLCFMFFDTAGKRKMVNFVGVIFIYLLEIRNQIFQLFI